MMNGLKLSTVRAARQMISVTLALCAACTPILAQVFPGSASSPPGFESVRASADAARDRGDRAAALQLYTRAVELQPGWPDGWWFIGTMEYSEDRYQQAAEALAHFISLTPHAAPALALRGLCEFETGQYGQSLADLQSGIAGGALNQPRNAQIILYHEALVLTRLGRFEEALGKYTAFVKQGADSPELALSVGLAGLRMPLLPANIEPTQSELIAATGRASIAQMTGDAVGSQQQFEALFTQYPTQQNLHYLHGYLLFPTDPDSAVAEFEQEVKLSPESAIAHAMSAWALGFQGDYTRALGDAQKAAEEDPSLTLGQLVYGRSLIETGSVANGIPHIESVIAREPGNLEAHMTLAKAYSKSGRPGDARRERLLCLSLLQKGSGPVATP